MGRLNAVTTDVSYLTEQERTDRALFVDSFRREYKITATSDLLLLELAADLYLRARAINKQEQQTGKFYLSARHDPVDKLVSILTSLNATRHSQQDKKATNDAEQQARELFMSLSKDTDNRPNASTVLRASNGKTSNTNEDRY